MSVFVKGKGWPIKLSPELSEFIHAVNEMEDIEREWVREQMAEKAREIDHAMMDGITRPFQFIADKVTPMTAEEWEATHPGVKLKDL